MLDEAWVKFLGLGHPASEACECAVPQDVKGQTETMSWLMFQMGGIGPMQGQANHFLRYAPEKIEYGINRYTNETRRLYQVTHRRTGLGSVGL